MNTPQHKRPHSVALTFCLLFLLIAGAAAAPGSGPANIRSLVFNEAGTGTAHETSYRAMNAAVSLAGSTNPSYTFQWAKPGTTSIDLPWGVATDSAGDIYASDNSDN